MPLRHRHTRSSSFAIALAALACTVPFACSSSSASPAFPDGGALVVPPVDAHAPRLSPPRDAGHGLGDASAAADARVDVANAADASDGGSGDAPPDAVDAGFVTAAHTLPVIPNQGGPELTHPLLVTVTFADDEQRAFVEGLGEYLVTSPWLGAVGSEYGIALGTHVNVELPTNAPTAISDPEIQALVESLVHMGVLPDSDAGVTAQELAPFADGGFADAGPDAWDGGGDGGPPVQMPQIIYMMYFPPTTAITVDGTPICDYSAGGYHYQTSLASYGQSFSYAVVTECPSATQAELVQITSHEFIEASTDPSQADRAYSITDLEEPWSYFGGEVGDLCSLLAPEWSEGGYAGIQRVYSDTAAAAGGDPCLPAPEPYYGADVVPGTAQAITAGAMMPFAVTGWSTSPVADWYLSSELYIASPSSFAPTFEVSASMLNNGGMATLTVSVPAGTPSGAYALGLVYSSRSDSDYTTTLVEIYVP